MGTDMVLGVFKDSGVTVEREIVRKGVDYELSFQRPDGFLPDAWGGRTLMHMISGLDTFLKLGVPCEEKRITSMISYLRARNRDLAEQIDEHGNLAIFKILDELSQKYEISLLE